MRFIRLLVSVASVFFVALPSCRSAESGRDLLKKAQYFADLYNWRAASPLFQKAEPMLRDLGDLRSAMYAHVGVLRLASTAPMPERSQELADLLSADPLFSEDRELRLFALTIKGDLDGEMDQAAAREDWTQVMTLSGQLNNTKWIYRAEGQLGFSDYYDGDLASCQRKVASALIAATKAGDVGARIFFLSTTALGLAMQHLLQPVAIEYAKQAIGLAKAHPDAGSALVANTALVRLLADVGKIPEAKQLNQKLLADPNLDYSERFNYLSSAGDIAVLEKDYLDGIHSFEKAILIGLALGATREVADLQSAVAYIYLSLGEATKAEELERNAVATLEQSRVVPLLPAKLDALAQILIAEGRYSDADSIYVQAEALQDTLIGKADSLLVKTALITGAGKLYAHHFALLAAHFKRPDEAYNVVEQGRGRAIVDLLLSGGAASPQAIETERAISKLRLEIKSLHSPDEIRRKREDIFLAEQARAVNPDLTILSTNQFQPIPLQTVQKSLRPSEMLLEYVLSEPCSYALVLTPTSKQIFTLASRKTIETMVTAYTTAVKNRTDSVRQARDLYRTLLGSIPGIEKKSDYIVVPDGGLNLLPFDAFMNPHHRYVVQSHVVTYSPSSTSFYLLRTKKLISNRPKAMLAVGGIPYSHSGIKRALVERGYNHEEEFEDLPNSEPEARLAATAMPNPENTELKGSAATETNLKQLLKRQFGYIHLAVHAFSSDNPDRASLVVLSDPSNGEDGFVQASEIVQMRLPARLVVLSACETDVGPVQGEEGISTLSTAFLLAGARTVVSTLWPIEDEPALVLMKRFYEHLGHNETTAEAMAGAKRDLLSKYGERSLPIYWAGFVVQGSEPTLQGAH